MGEFQIVAVVIGVNALVLGIVFLTLYGFNKAVSQCGR